MFNSIRQYLKQRYCKTSRYDVLFNRSLLGICIIDNNCNIKEINNTLCQLLQIDPIQSIGTSLRQYVKHSPDWCQLKRRMINNKSEVVDQIQLVDTNGNTLTAIVGLSPINHQFIVTIVDITKQIEDEETIYHLAYYDTLTGLPNRFHFNERAQDIVETAAANNTQFAVFIIDVDNFKRINDTLGHHVGDQLLQQFAVRLGNAVSQSCSSKYCGHNFAARLGGDEFVVLVENVLDITHAQHVAETIYDQFDAPLLLDHQNYFVKLSLGIGMYPHDGNDISSLLKSADLALYAAKNRGKNQYFFHEASMSSRLEQIVYYEKAIKYFITSQDFDLAIQPIMCCSTHKIVGGEILFRGNSTKFKDINLQKLITIAEDSGDIVALGKQILYNSCKRGISCIEADPTIVLSVNCSIRELEDFDFVNDFKRTLEITQFPAKNIAIEATESVFMSKFKQNVNKLKQIKKLGVGISIDDFGKGYSSMSYLRYLPANKLKIDREFITDIETDTKSQEIIKGITLMGQTLDMKICVEGVENRQQLDLLKQSGVDQIQGYFLGPPTTFDNFKQLLEKQKCQ